MAFQHRKWSKRWSHSRQQQCHLFLIRNTRGNRDASIYLHLPVVFHLGLDFLSVIMSHNSLFWLASSFAYDKLHANLDFFLLAQCSFVSMGTCVRSGPRLFRGIQNLFYDMECSHTLAGNSPFHTKHQTVERKNFSTYKPSTWRNLSLMQDSRKFAKLRFLQQTLIWQRVLPRYCPDVHTKKFCAPWEETEL